MAQSGVEGPPKTTKERTQAYRDNNPDAIKWQTFQRLCKQGVHDLVLPRLVAVERSFARLTQPSSAHASHTRTHHTAKPADAVRVILSDLGCAITVDAADDHFAVGCA